MYCDHLNTLQMNSRSFVIWLFWAKPPRRSFSSCSLSPRLWNLILLVDDNCRVYEFHIHTYSRDCCFILASEGLDHAFIMCKPLQCGGLVSKITLRTFSLWSHQQPRFHSAVNAGRRKWQIYASWYCHWSHALLTTYTTLCSKVIGSHQSAFSASIEALLFQILRICVFPVDCLAT